MKVVEFSDLMANTFFFFADEWRRFRSRDHMNYRREDALKDLVETYARIATHPYHSTFEEAYEGLTSFDNGANPFTNYANGVIRKLAKQGILATEGKGALARIKLNANVEITPSETLSQKLLSSDVEQTPDN